MRCSGDGVRSECCCCASGVLGLGYLMHAAACAVMCGGQHSTWVRFSRMHRTAENPLHRAMHHRHTQQPPPGLHPTRPSHRVCGAPSDTPPVHTHPSANRSGTLIAMPSAHAPRRSDTLRSGTLHPLLAVPFSVSYSVAHCKFASCLPARVPEHPPEICSIRELTTPTCGPCRFLRKHGIPSVESVG